MFSLIMGHLPVSGLPEFGALEQTHDRELVPRQRKDGDIGAFQCWYGQPSLGVSSLQLFSRVYMVSCSMLALLFSDTVVILTSIKSVFVDKVETPFIEKQTHFAEKFTRLVSVQEVFNPLEIIIGDSIVFWRVWVLCAGDKRLVLIPFLFLLGTIACSLGFLGCFAQNNWPVINPPTCNTLVVSAYSLSLVTNVVCTVAIGFQVWLYNRDIKAYLTTYKQGRAEKILVILLESGIIYSLVWVVQLVVVHIPPAPTLSGKVFQQILKAANVQFVVGTCLCTHLAIYPTALIVVIYLQRSVWDSTGNSSFVEVSTPNVNRDLGERASQGTILENYHA
ncbi:hypothetical protein PM082_023915 [Marasmius tenuissimus]|nr:hypothetical protein PM082_023915 [Marasmius tenuissimus]